MIAKEVEYLERIRTVARAIAGHVAGGWTLRAEVAGIIIDVADARRPLDRGVTIASIRSTARDLGPDFEEAASEFGIASSTLRVYRSQALTGLSELVRREGATGAREALQGDPATAGATLRRAYEEFQERQAERRPKRADPDPVDAAVSALENLDTAQLAAVIARVGAGRFAEAQKALEEARAAVRSA